MRPFLGNWYCFRFATIKIENAHALDAISLSLLDLSLAFQSREIQHFDKSSNGKLLGLLTSNNSESTCGCQAGPIIGEDAAHHADDDYHSE